MFEVIGNGKCIQVSFYQSFISIEFLLVFDKFQTKTYL